MADQIRVVTDRVVDGQQVVEHVIQIDGKPTDKCLVFR